MTRMLLTLLHDMTTCVCVCVCVVAPMCACILSMCVCVCVPQQRCGEEFLSGHAMWHRAADTWCGDCGGQVNGGAAAGRAQQNSALPSAGAFPPRCVFGFVEKRIQAGHTPRTACITNLLRCAHTSKPILCVASTFNSWNFCFHWSVYAMHYVMQGGLWDHITAREHIEIYAAIKSLPQPVRSSEAKRNGHRYQSCNELIFTQASSGDSCRLEDLAVTQNGCFGFENRRLKRAPPLC
eukprot:COSAG06_NODE_8515_length_2143_cov_2.722114_3_plen_237_part_00